MESVSSIRRAGKKKDQEEFLEKVLNQKGKERAILERKTRNERKLSYAMEE